MANALYVLMDGPSVSGQMVCPPFQAGSLANAQTLAQSFATLMGRNVTLVPAGTLGPFTTYTAGGQGGTVTSPSGITY